MYFGILKMMFGTMTETHYIYLMKMETSYYRRITVISIILLSLISIVSSLDFEIDYPKEVEVNSEFLVKLSSDTNINHDLKIFVEDDSRDFSEIYNNDWKSLFYYINNIFPEKYYLCNKMAFSNHYYKFQKNLLN